MRILAAALLAAGVTSGLGLSLATAPVSAAQESACAELGGSVDPEQMCRVHVSNPTYTLDFTFPADYPDQRAVADYLKQTRDGFVNVSDMPGSWNLPYVLDARGTDYRSGPPAVPGEESPAPQPDPAQESDGTRSVVFEVYENVGGPHPQTWYKSFNWDLEAQAPMTFETLFRPGTRPLDVIFPIVQEDLARQLGVDSPISSDDGLDPAKYQEFALTDDELIFFFGQGEIMAGAGGALRATVPRSAVASMLA
ncbi:MAG: esterase [Actinomycetota bacterium]|nr:esterase [Actinomycetota bacterium]